MRISFQICPALIRSNKTPQFIVTELAKKYLNATKKKSAPTPKFLITEKNVSSL